MGKHGDFAGMSRSQVICGNKEIEKDSRTLVVVAPQSHEGFC